MIEILEQMPNQWTTFDIQDDARQVLFELGMSDSFSKKPNRHRVYYATKYKHPTHYILALRFTGSIRAEDNVCIVYCLPKSQYTVGEFVGFQQSKSAIPGYDEVVMKEVIPPNSSEN